MNTEPNAFSSELSPSIHASGAAFFPGWTRCLHNDDSLSPGLREVYRRALAGFLQFCQQRRSAPSVALARDYVELSQLEHAPSPAQLQEWLRNAVVGAGDGYPDGAGFVGA